MEIADSLGAACSTVNQDIPIPPLQPLQKLKRLFPCSRKLFGQAEPTSVVLGVQRTDFFRPCFSFRDKILRLKFNGHSQTSQGHGRQDSRFLLIYPSLRD